MTEDMKLVREAVQLFHDVHSGKLRIAEGAYACRPVFLSDLQRISANLELGQWPKE
jgi:hypothetical protein